MKEMKIPQQVLDQALEEKIDSKTKFIKEYMNDHNGGTPRWLRGIFFTEEEKIKAILDCMDNMENFEIAKARIENTPDNLFTNQ